MDGTGWGGVWVWVWGGLYVKLCWQVAGGWLVVGGCVLYGWLVVGLVGGGGLLCNVCLHRCQV